MAEGWRRGALAAVGATLLAGPTALAFYSGGYFQGPRVWAGAGAWACVVVALVAGAPLPRGRGALLAIGGMALLAGWTLLSILWAPLAGDAYGAGQIAMLYLGALLAAAMVLRDRLLPWVEPVLAAGSTVVVGYGLAGRLLPGLLHFARSVSAQGRLEQPLTYWNGMGELAALGFVLCVRLAGDRSRPGWLRSVAAAATAPLGLGLYISFSRGALFACVAGLLALVVLAPWRQQLAALLLAVGVGVVASLAVAAFKGVTSLSGSLSTRESQGAIVLGLLVVIAVGAGVIQYVLVAQVEDRPLGLPRRAPLIVTGLIAVGLTLAIVVGAHESSGTSATLSGGATRLTSLQSNRYAYWSVALRAFGTEPLHGVGAGGWSVDWLRWRTVAEGAQDAHSLPLQTLAELGVVGLGLLGIFLGGVTWAAVDALRAAGGVASGPIAGCVVYLTHAPLDWDWQMPAVTLVAIALAGALLALASRERRGSDVDGVSTGPRRSAALPA
ncbi:MAG: O-antigen ligase family protein [Solirubrobacteraceae bacterium]